MEPQEPEEPFFDDQDVEIVDLPGDEPTKYAKRRRPRSSRPPRWRLLQLIGIIILGVCFLSLLLRGTPDLRPTLFTGIFGPPPTPTTVSGPNSNLFYVNASPPWGVLSIDGKKIARLPDPASGRPLQLAPGSHHLAWSAAPFSTQSCVISIPSRVSDTCPADESVQTPNRQSAWIISLQNSMFTLPQDQQNALAAQIQQMLNSLQAGDLVHPGELFLDTPINATTSSPLPPPTETTHQTLRATLHFTRFGYLQGGSCMGLNMSNSCEINGQDCHTLCTLGNQGNIWKVAAVVGTSWTYTTLNGRVVATNMADEEGSEIDHLLPLSINWDGTRWHVQNTQQFINGSIPCVAASDQSALGNAFDTFGTSPFQAFSWNFVPAPNIAAGCLIVLTSLVNGGPSPTASSRIIYLHRFGTFIAVNRLAQEYNSDAPHPTAYEMSLAHELAAQEHITFS